MSAAKTDVEQTVEPISRESEIENTLVEDATASDEESYDPSEADLAEIYGGAPLREEDFQPAQDGELPDLETLKKRVPAKTQVLMDELFRASLQKVQRINPKSIR